MRWENKEITLQTFMQKAQQLLTNKSEALNEVSSFRIDDEYGVTSRSGEMYRRGKVNKSTSLLSFYINQLSGVCSCCTGHTPEVNLQRSSK